MLSKDLHRKLVVLGLLLMAVGMPFSNVLMSIGQFVLAGNWLLETNYLQKLRALFKNKLSLILIGVFLFHVIGMLWTEDTHFGWRDVRIKLPLLLMPLLVFTSERISSKQFKFLLGSFVFAVTVGTLASTLIYMGVTGEDILNRRKMMPFISHIRFSLMVVMSIAICGYFAFVKQGGDLKLKVGLFALIGWLFFYLVLQESASGYMAFGCLLAYLVLRGILAGGSTRRRLAVLSVGTILGLSTLVYLKHVVDRHYYEIPFTVEEMEFISPAGNPYAHSLEVTYCENGHRIYNYLQMDELRKEWPKVSDYDFDGQDDRGEELWPTLIRYMTSQGLRKDSVDFQKLSEQDIRNIERGITNPDKEKMWGVAPRIESFLWEYDKFVATGDPSRSSFILRLMYVKTGIQLFKENPILGIGTGDSRLEYFNYYEQNNVLKGGHKAWAHNQYLTMFVCLGLVGGLWFLLSLMYQLTLKPGLLYMMFFVIVCASFLADDTLETQAGITFYTFFNTVLLARRVPVRTDASTDPSD